MYILFFQIIISNLINQCLIYVSKWPKYCGPYCLGVLREKQSERSPLLQYLEIFDNIMNNVFLIILGQLKLDLMDEK
jgi:hypothetical protein